MSADHINVKEYVDSIRENIKSYYNKLNEKDKKSFKLMLDGNYLYLGNVVNNRREVN